MEATLSGFSNLRVDNRTLLISGLISLVLHTFGLILLIWMPTLSWWGPEELGPVYTVDLVGNPGLPAPPPIQGDPDAGPVEASPESVAVPEPVPAPVEKAELIPVGKEPEKVKEVKKPPKIEPVVKMGTPKKSSKLVQDQPEDDIDKALDKLQKKVTTEKPAPKPGVQGQDTEKLHLDKALARVRERVDSGVYGVGAGDGGGGGADSRMARYYTAVWQKIRSNWTLPSEWSDSKMEAVVIISLLPNGAITSIKFERRSGYPTFDQSVLWAVERSNPLPPLPTGISTGPLEIGVRFKPEG